MFENVAGLPLDLPHPARKALIAAGIDWHDEHVAEAHVQHALMLAPEALATRIGAYKFYFYRHRLQEALPHAFSVLEMAAKRLQLPHDWRLVSGHHAGFDEIEPWPRLFLQALIAYGYCLVRLGRMEEGRAALAKAMELDGSDKLGAGRLVAVIDRGGLDEDEDGD
ncbi:hypothetical protein [Magnetospirillum sp. 64-120]|uniref:hypothetical protein n=1 Tax=Magnetospirillum sp. 64-120 TaxID=1895778 RepID=UPI00092C97E0|nr:hypothetical protein [Magnetospirillum sp. 64-120]OJX71889.1 MAG: hypothetical protein BGO92_04400 [Magnetospirillum sp. 64-120]